MEEKLEIKEIEDEIEDYQTIDVENSPEEDEDANKNDTKIYPNASIKIDKDQYSVFELKRKYDKGKICMDSLIPKEFCMENKADVRIN